MIDMVFAARALRTHPGFTATVVLTLALATGATTAIFSVVLAVLLRPLPFRAPDRLVNVAEVGKVGGPGPVFFGDLEAFRRETRLFESFAGHFRTTKHLEGSSSPERLTAIVVDREFFRLLGVDPIAGRTIREDDTGQVAVISARLWQDRFARSRDLIGQGIPLAGQRWSEEEKRTVFDRRPFTVVGVMPETFQYPYAATTSFPGAMPEGRTDVWIYDERDRRPSRLTVIGRMKPGVAIQAASAELTAIESRLDVIAPSPSRAVAVQLTSVADDVLGTIHRPLWLLVGAVALVLGAACANVANLTIARAMARAREVATRTALGAGRARLARQFLAESVLLALGGGLLGLVIARWGMTVLIAVGSAKIPRAHEIALDWQVFAFLLLLCLATAVVFGLAPAIGAARADISTLTRESGGHATSSPTFRRLRDLLVVAEVALAFVLALGAAHVVVELNRLRHAESGMSPEDVMTFHMTPRVPDADYLHIEQRLTQLSRVVAAGWIQLVPLQNWGWEGDYRLRERPQDAQPAVELRTVSPGYFAALGVPIVAGRGPAAGDVSGNSQNILINTALARRDFAGENPIGRQTSRGTIVGVVGDVRQVSLDRPPVPEIYQPLGGPGGIATDLGLTLIVRAAGPRDELVARVRAIVREVNPTLAIFDVKPMTQVVEDSLWELNLYRWLIGLFAALALLLAVIGLYGVISYGVSARTRELAIRLALGSNQHRLARLVIGRGLLLTIAGLLVGGATSLVVFGLLPDRPLGASPGAALFAVIAALVVAVSLAAVAAPASRVLAMSPLTALRQD